jgi:hypothetical protein
MPPLLLCDMFVGESTCRTCGESWKGSGEPPVGVMGLNERGVCGPDHVPESRRILVVCGAIADTHFM